MPERIQLRRTPGWRLVDISDHAVNVARPGPWGNPYTVDAMRRHLLGMLDQDPDSVDPAARPTLDEQARRLAVDAFASDLEHGPDSRWWWYGPHEQIIRIKGRLQDGLLHGYDLACWCPPPRPGDLDICHAAVLLDHANRPENHP